MSDNQQRAAQQKAEADAKTKAKADAEEEAKAKAAKAEEEAGANASTGEGEDSEVAQLRAELAQLKAEKAEAADASTVDLPAEETKKPRRGTEGTITADATGRSHDKTGKVLRKSDPGLVRIVEARDQARRAAKS